MKYTREQNYFNFCKIMQKESEIFVRYLRGKDEVATRTGLSRIRRALRRLNSGRIEAKWITIKMIFARNGKRNTRKQEAEGRESFNRMSGHVFRGGSGSQLPGHLCKSWLEPTELSALCTPF